MKLDEYGKNYITRLINQNKKIEDAERECIKSLHESGLHEPEEAHKKADSALLDLLLKLGFHNIVREYENIKPKWYA